MLATGKDGALLRFSLGNEYLKAGDAASRPAPRARRGAGSYVYGRVEAVRKGPGRGGTRGRRARRVSTRHRGCPCPRRQVGGTGNDGVRAPDREGARRRVTSARRADPATPRFASASARSLPGWSLWPFTQCQRIWCCAASVSSSRQSSAFFTGFLSAVFQPLRFQPWIQRLDAVLHVLRVGVDIDVAAARQRSRARGSPRSAPSGCWSSPARRRTTPSRARPRPAARPSRRARDCPCTRRRCRS